MYGKEEDFYSLKGTIVELLNIMGIKDLHFIAESEYGVYHPGRCARIVARHVVELENGPAVEDVELGIMGEVHPDVAENYGMDGMRIYCCEIMFDTIIRHANTNKVYKPLPKYPSTSRDIALLVEEDVLVAPFYQEKHTSQASPLHTTSQTKHSTLMQFLQLSQSPNYLLEQNMHQL